MTLRIEFDTISLCHIKIKKIRKDISENIIKEVLQNNRELNFLRRTEEEKEAIRGAIIAAVDEIVHAEITKIIKSSDI